jgi:hypothetical protein
MSLWNTLFGINLESLPFNVGAQHMMSDYEIYTLHRSQQQSCQCINCMNYRSTMESMRQNNAGQQGMQNIIDAQYEVLEDKPKELT